MMVTMTTWTKIIEITQDWVRDEVMKMMMVTMTTSERFGVLLTICPRL